MKLERLLGITTMLMTKGRVTATTLADRFEVSVRTIYRDLDLINQSGIPIVSFPGTDGGYEIMDGFYLSKQHFSLEDMRTVYHLLQSFDASPFQAISEKLASVQPLLLTSDNHSVIFSLSSSEEERTYIQKWTEAIHQMKQVSFTYTSGTGEVTTRTVEPRNLHFDYGTWYAEAFCLTRQADRLFRLSRMKSLVVLVTNFTPKPRESTPHSISPTPLHLRFSQDVKQRVLEQFPEQTESCKDHLYVHTAYYHPTYALSIVLSYGSNVEVISPLSLRKEVLEEIKKITEIYNEGDK
ncbi:YafY family protein [Geomicrobium sp. JCM 19039]|uniref:helix-turn-helix transcriptional regulator n=1 Tax=Geomicrobium sp. JCM 19039 TaxID=1460636 RepID=UPI00045F4600|nr:YafY family protein [Geomicrobium sp. JCM 19039]GAK13999.1 transcriptional regulator, DeoR family [Geomicrobium sp. JCM 19039]